MTEQKKKCPSSHYSFQSHPRSSFPEQLAAFNILLDVLMNLTVEILSNIHIDQTITLCILTTLLFHLSINQ